MGWFDDPLHYPPCCCGNPICPEVRRMSANNSKHTVAAALGRQERDSEAIGAKTPQERQQVVSLGLDEKADREGRVWAGPSET